MLRSERGAGAGTIDKSARDVDMLVYLILQRDAQVMLTVVLGVSMT